MGVSAPSVHCSEVGVICSILNLVLWSSIGFSWWQPVELKAIREDAGDRKQSRNRGNCMYVVENSNSGI